MTKHHKDIAMVDDLEQSAELRSLLRAGIDDDVAGYDFQAGLATHIAAVAALPPATTTPHAPPAAAAGVSGKALLAWIGAPLASASVIAALWFNGSAEPPHDVARPAPTPATIVAPTPVEPVAAAPEAVIAAPTATTEGAAPEPAAAVRDEKPARARRSARAVTTSTQVDSATTTVPTVNTTTNIAATAAAVPAPIVVDTQPVDVEPTAAERAATERQAAEQAEQERLAREEARRVAEARLKREMAQLMQATQALNSNPTRALSLAQAGEQEFRSSLFSEERQHVLLLALIKLGRVDEAQRLSVPYLRAHPDSPFARRVRNALEAAQ